MKNDVLVSVVLPCYNAEAYIEDAVNSMLQQTHTNLEVIVVNDASTDSSLQKLNAITDKRLKVITNEINLGYPGSMNNGIAIAKGKYIARMDADDICTLDRIKMQVELHEQNPNCAFVSAKRCLLSPNGIAYTQEEIINDASFFEETWENLFSGDRCFTDAAALILKSNIDEVGGYNTYMRAGMDVDLWLRILEKTKAKVLVLNKMVFMRRLLPEALTFSIKTNNDLVREKASERYLQKKYIPKNIVSQSTKKQAHIRFLSTIAVHCYLVGDTDGFWRFLKKALSYRSNMYNAVILNVFKKYYHYKKTKSIKIIHD